MKGIAALLIAFLALPSRAATPALCQPNHPRQGDRFEIGLQLRGLVPNKLPDFDNSLTVYGPIVGIPLFGNTLQLTGLYGTAETTIASLTELSYRFDLPTPFFNGFAAVGAHFLHYSKSSINHDEFGGNLGLGLSFAMGRNFELTLSLKTYVQSRAILSFGGGFSFLI